MLADQQTLQSCYELGKLGVTFKLITGTRIGRGFADVGFEEYSVLDQSRAVSMLTGGTIALDEFYLNYYFLVPSVDEVAREIFERHWDIGSVEFHEQRDWVVTVRSVKKNEMATPPVTIVSKPYRQLNDAMIHVLKKILNVG